MLAQENAAAYFIKLGKEDLTYLEDAFGKDKVYCTLAELMLDYLPYSARSVCQYYFCCLLMKMVTLCFESIIVSATLLGCQFDRMLLLTATHVHVQVVGGRYAASHAMYLHDAKKTGAAA